MQYYMLRRARKPMESKGGESRASEKQNPAASQRGEKGGKLSLRSRIRRPSADSRYLGSGITIGMQLNP